MREDEEYTLTNREKVRQPKLGRTYCACDRNMVGDGEQCSLCGWINKKYRAPRRDYR